MKKTLLLLALCIGMVSVNAQTKEELHAQKAEKQAIADAAQGEANALQAKIDALQNTNSSQIESAKLEESKLGLAPVTFLLVEQKLTKLGFEPGRIDGKLSDESRKAIRRFQRAAELPVTGYLSRATVVRLIAAN